MYTNCFNIALNDPETSDIDLHENNLLLDVVEHWHDGVLVLNQGVGRRLQGCQLRRNTAVHCKLATMASPICNEQRLTIASVISPHHLCNGSAARVTLAMSAEFVKSVLSLASKAIIASKPPMPRTTGSRMLYEKRTAM
jgi:hypothetical protein